MIYIGRITGVYLCFDTEDDLVHLGRWRRTTSVYHHNKAEAKVAAAEPEPELEPARRILYIRRRGERFVSRVVFLQLRAENSKINHQIPRNQKKKKTLINSPGWKLLQLWCRRSSLGDRPQLRNWN